VKTATLCSIGLVWAGAAAAQQEMARQEISVRVCNAVRVPEPTLEAAEKEAMFVLGTAGVGVKWLDCSTATMERELGPRDFVLTLAGFRSTNEKGRFVKQIMGGTWDLDRGTKESHLTVYYNAVKEFVSNNGKGDELSIILGYALAHEFGHLFMGKQHTHEGVMRRDWGSGDLDLMKQNGVRFSAVERERFQRELLERDGVWNDPTLLAAAKSRLFR
jgi:hypothetical protein